MDATDTPFFTSRSGASWYVSLLGGIKRRGRWEMPKDMRMIGVLGGANFDLTEAVLPEAPVLTKFSLIGGVSLRVPQDVDVVVEGGRLFGGVKIAPADREGPARITFKVREFSLAGGVSVERA
jgi:hypothetical protein